MTEKLKKTIAEELEKMPIEIKEAINSIDWGKISEKVGSQYSLNSSETDKLQLEIFLVLAQMEFLRDLKTNLEKNIQIKTKVIEQIIQELEEFIFKPIARKVNENVKNSPKYKNPDWKQTIDFILSGGDYSIFLQK